MRVIRNYALKTRIIDTCPLCGSVCTMVNTKTDSAEFNCGLRISLDWRTMSFIVVNPCSRESTVQMPEAAIER